MRVRRRNGAPSERPRAIETCDGWTLLNTDQLYLGHHYLEIMQQMNRVNYSPARPERVVWRMSRPPSEYYHFAGAGFEIVLGFKWIKRLRRYRIMSTGFIGAISPAEALDRIAAKVRAFAHAKGVDRLVAVQPWQMDSRHILEMYELLKTHPALDVRGGHRLPDGEYLWIRIPRLN